MDSLLANYASSDEEEETEENNHLQRSITSPKPVSSFSSLLSSLPQPKSKHSSSTSVIHHNHIDEDKEDPKPSTKSTSVLFSSIPKPKTKSQQQPTSDSNNPKSVVQFKLPINPNYAKPTGFHVEDEEDEEDEEEKERKQCRESISMSQSSSSVKSFLSSIPAPKNSNFGVLPSASGSGRRSMIGIEAPVSGSGAFGVGNDKHTVDNESASDQNYGNYVNYGSCESGLHNQVDQNVVSGDDGSSYGSCRYYENYVDYGQYDNNWGDGITAVPATATMPEITGPSESAILRVPGKKRGKNEIPTEIIEVKQDELTKNHPREDQGKLTGIAFGPSYQPASTKGKPTKLHKRKHQIGSLYFDMKQKEMEFAERRAKGFLTKAQTHAKYGW